jgi:hypothetical protein
MNLERILILAGAIWCSICACICVVGGVVAIACNQPDACVDPGFEAARVWSRLAWWTIPMFGAGSFFGFRAVWPHLRLPKLRRPSRSR